MKNYFNIILIGSILLLLFPFLGLPEIWENIYVVLFAFVIGYTSMLLRHKSGLVKSNNSDTNFQDYVKELQEKFSSTKESLNPSQEKKSRVSDIQLHDE